MKSQLLISLNPSRGYERIGSVPISTADDIREKVNAARQAYPAWKSRGATARCELLEKLYALFSQNKDAIGHLASQEMGMPASVRNVIDLDNGLNYMRGYLDHAQEWLAPEIVFENSTEIHYLTCEPRGVVGASIPWNFPFCNFIWAVIPNLLVGNTIVLKHSEECPLTAHLLEDIVNSVGLPHGVFNQVFGDGANVGEQLMNSAIDCIWFTGSTGVGKHLYEVAARKFIPALLELGGSAPGIVFEDITLQPTLESIYFNRFINSGQTCDGLKRLIVHERHFDEIVTRLQNILQSKKLGDAQDPSVDIGPLVAERQVQVLHEQVEDARTKGATVIIGGKQPPNLSGAYYEPTILTNITFDMRVWREEVFGPVLPIVSFKTEEQAIALANDTRYGLGAYVYTNDKEQAWRVSNALQTGNISVNSANYVIAQDPFGGYKDSGLGREHGKLGFRELCCTKVIALKK